MKSKGEKSVQYVVLPCFFKLISKCQAAESNSCPSSLSSKASPELCCVGWVLVETT